MPDPRFFRRAGPFSVGELAIRVGGELAASADTARVIGDIGGVETAGEGEIAYFADQRYVLAFASSRCGACITTPEFAPRAPGHCAVITVGNPRAAFAEVASAFYPPESPSPSREPIAADAQIARGAVVMPGAVIGAHAVIGEGAIIGSGAVIGAGVVIGAGSRIGANVTLTHCIIGTRVIIHPGVQIGQDGFGFVPCNGAHRKIPQLGRVIVGDDVEIGANTTIDRGAAADTVIGTGTKIDNLVQIAHNVRIGDHCIIVSQVGISGSCTIGNHVVIGGQVGLADHVHVGDRAQIAAKSGVMRDIAPGEIVMGYPARPIRQFWRDTAALSRLTRRDK
jgi:UDP-3-O-[3-hydroxymyristoyl] glucosamine N-acyltransferase